MARDEEEFSDEKHDLWAALVAAAAWALPTHAEGMHADRHSSEATRQPGAAGAAERAVSIEMRESEDGMPPWPGAG
ncbi:hypothetical protein VQ042_24255 [Aurantimonas sp. A2-1-M11]|uniref:hypothetical protein n=1 Tax=Aurantimonas sp. A2-1-M11 TaxID=3113712 RepID=UPI002F924C02